MHPLAAAVQVQVTQLDGRVFGQGDFLVVKDVPLTVLLDVGDVMTDQMRSAHVRNDGGQFVSAGTVAITRFRTSAYREGEEQGE